MGKNQKLGVVRFDNGDKEEGKDIFASGDKQGNELIFAVIGGW